MTERREPDESPHPVATKGGSLRTPLIVVAVLAILVAAAGIYSRVKAQSALKEATQEQAVVAVAVTQPMQGPKLENLVLPGDVLAFTETPIYARTNGYLKRWTAEIGTRVKAGQLLAEIDTPEVDQQLRQAQADLATAEANFRSRREHLEALAGSAQDRIGHAAGSRREARRCRRQEGAGGGSACERAAAARAAGLQARRGTVRRSRHDAQHAGR